MRQRKLLIALLVAALLVLAAMGMVIRAAGALRAAAIGIAAAGCLVAESHFFLPSSMAFDVRYHLHP